MKLNHCIRINLARSAPDHGCKDAITGKPKQWAIPVDERAATLLDLAACAEQVKAKLDLSDLFFPKVFVDDGLADHRALTEALIEYGKHADLIVQA
jgi:hypothetical protein